MRTEASALGGKLVAAGKAAARFGGDGMKTALAGLKSFASGYHQLGERMKAAGFRGTLRMIKDGIVGFASAAKTSATGALRALKNGFVGAAKSAVQFAVSGLKSALAALSDSPRRRGHQRRVR